MVAWRICIVVLAAVCVSCEGAPSLHEESFPVGRFVELRKLLTETSKGSDGVQSAGAVSNTEMNSDGSGHAQVGDDTVARFETDASGNSKGSTGSDESGMEAEGTGSGHSSVTSGGGSVATIETKDDGKSPDAILEASDLGELGTSGMTIVDHAPSGTIFWLRDAFTTATQGPPVVSDYPPIGNTPAQVRQGISSGNGVSSPDSYYSRNRQAIQNAGGTDLPEPANGFKSSPKPLLTRYGTAPG